MTKYSFSIDSELVVIVDLRTLRYIITLKINHQRIKVFATNLNIPFPLFLQPGGVNLLYLNLDYLI